MNVDQELYERARARVKEIKSLVIHGATYVIVMLGLFGINATGTDARQGNWWVVWPAAIWGTILLIHIATVLAGGFGQLEGWEERKVEDLVRREKERHAA